MFEYLTLFFCLYYSYELNNYNMEVFGIIGFVFGLIALSMVIQLKTTVETLKKDIEELKKEASTN